MSSFQFNAKSQKVNQLCQETIDILEIRTEDEVKKLVDNFQDFWEKYQQQKKLSIAFIGQYNAGKSTLIKALTGDESVRISAEICTDKVTEYAWQDVLLLDTPGIYAGNKQHDGITLERISKCDLLVFVVPNELFNPQGAEFFQKVANQMQRVGQMVLVVNKMSRESGSPQDLLSTITQVIEPYYPQQFYTCFIDADSYLKSQDPKYIKYQQSLQTKSNFNDFLDSLEKLIQKNELSAKLVTPLHDAVDTLEKSLNCLSTNDEKTRNLLEILRREKIIIQASQTRARNAYRSELAKLKHEVIMLGEKIASMIDGHHTEEKINREVKQGEIEITTLSEKIIAKIQAALEEELKTLEEKLKDLQNSQLGKTIDREIVIDLVDGKRINDTNIPDEFGQSILEKQGGKVLRGIGKLSSKVSRNLVYKTGKFIGIKFKPFGAIKAAKFIRNLGPIFAIGGVVLDAVMTDKEEKEYKKYQHQLRNARNEVREKFGKVAEEMVEEYELNIEEAINFYDEKLNNIENNQQELRNFDQSKHEILTQIEQKIKEIKKEIKILLK
ncbi:50S ribosome-binding GTPase [Anabaena aphanizomenioides LEGE 00250]|uniref:50S ribosome-binding GTPase n=1 Tax=Sphaerospermopsis aphanizomenoides LEGE 00250 TaxID=2777972 RepID=A0ABR9VH28_9CYAN|nr:GTPase [Sphaerospermopsis aphanizomenoides]MBE9237796.1 50S ribosome-binding GTPase [Sphaerospermopsis aphanizomenoides LEGE 00250]